MADGRELTKDQVGESSPDEQGQIDYSQIAQQEAFLGDVPYDTIVESIKSQFENYIKMEDDTNYVDIFYNQLHQSYQAIIADEEEAHPVELKEILDKIHDEFIGFLSKEFEERLTISIVMIEEEDLEYNQLEYIFRRLYEFFILGAKSNFKVVIATDMAPRLQKEMDDALFFKTIGNMMHLYSPLVQAVTPTEFIQMKGNKEIEELFDTGQVTGNFLRKYSPKFYENDEFQVEVINYVTMVVQLGKEIANATE